MSAFLGVIMALSLSGCASSVAVRYGFNLQRPEGIASYQNLGFVCGERFRLRLMPEQTCYVYVLHQGSNGEWSMLFPLAEEQRGENFVRKDSWVQIPAKGWYRMDDQPGVERLYVLACRKAIGEIEQLRNTETLNPAQVDQVFSAVDTVYNVHMKKESRQVKLDHVRHRVKGHDEFPVLQFSIDMLHQ